ncbi:GDSL-like Lipase/Acylhydrolase-domain-containing protein [Pilaira anomala]|nr:GDSL-like Lipase/Acylhydrolase-domain-containing protein [Pilaira anomala]
MKKYTFLLLWIPWTLAEVINNIVVFGDSYSDVGNSQRLTNGPVWSEDLAVGWNASLYSFAFSGAVCNNSYYEPQLPFIPSVTDQVEMYYKQDLNLNVEETAIIFWIGINDIFQIFQNNTTDDQDIKLELKKVVDCIGNNMRNIRKVFSANKFIVFGVPPLERMPYYANNTNLSESREERAANQLNELLTKEVEKMNKHSQHLELDLVDVHKLLDDIVDNPELFGLKNANDSYWDTCQGKCTEDIDSYVWWDKTHLTGGVHRLIANSILMAGSLATETYLDDELDIPKLLAEEHSIYQSPVYKPQKSTGEIEKVIERLKQEEMDNTLPKEQVPSVKEQQEQQKKNNSSTKYYLYFGITATLIVSIAFILFIKTKRRGNHLAALSGLINKPDSRGRFLPLHNMDSSNT